MHLPYSGATPPPAPDGRGLAQRRDSLGSFLAKLTTIEIDRKILMRAAGPMLAPLGTLDAIHLVTALSWREEHHQPLIFATHDQALGQAARLYGLNVVGA